jgi:ABC-2 type transport system ATP-binding protein
VSDPALETVELTKRFGDLVALESVSLKVEPGEIFALLGPNGAGKTTLIGAVCGLVKKTSGKVKIFGKDLDADPLSPRFDIGLVPQEVNFDPFFTVAEALRIHLGYFGKKPDPARVTEVLDALKLTAKADAKTRELSGGMKRRLLIAKALVHRPRLVFLDEPTAGVDIELRRDLWAYVRKLQKEGTTLILTTHYLEEAEELADRVGIIDNGKLMLVESKASLLRRLGERRLELKLSTAIPALPSSAAGAGAVLAEDRLSISYVEQAGKPGIAEVLGTLMTAGLPLAEVETRRARLEDVMLHVLRGERR